MSGVMTPKPLDARELFVAYFGIDGSLEGHNHWSRASLSKDWLAVCDTLVEEIGTNFNHQWQGNISNIRTKLTYIDDVGICTFFWNDLIASMILILAGQNVNSEAHLTSMFVSSLSKIEIIRTAMPHSDSFKSIFAFRERPAMIVVQVPNFGITDLGYDLVRELSIHLGFTLISKI